MDDEIIYSLGVDLDSTMSFHDNDLNLSKYEDNLVQSVVNRLNTSLDELTLFYEDYGSVFKSFFGWKANDETLGFIRAELETVLRSEPRIISWNFNVEYEGNGVLKVDLELYPKVDYSVTATLQLTNTGVEVI